MSSEDALKRKRLTESPEPEFLKQQVIEQPSSTSAGDSISLPASDPAPGPASGDPRTLTTSEKLKNFEPAVASDNTPVDTADGALNDDPVKTNGLDARARDAGDARDPPPEPVSDSTGAGAGAPSAGDNHAYAPKSLEANGTNGTDVVMESPDAPGAAPTSNGTQTNPEASASGTLGHSREGIATSQGENGTKVANANADANVQSQVKIEPAVEAKQEVPLAKPNWPRIITARDPQLAYRYKTGLCYDVRMRYHSRLNITPAAYVDPHPEDPRRTFRIYKTIAEAGLITDTTLRGTDELGDLMEKIPVVEAEADQLLLVHSQAHLDHIASTQNMTIEELVHETEAGDSIYLNNDSYLAAKLSCGGAIESCRAVVEGRVKNALAVIRPPGHHAEPEAPGGFCLFSNVSVAAKVMLRDYPDQVKKIVILDWDVHHGNGTQKAFYDDPRVLYISIHRYEKGSFYPGTKYGGATVVGGGPGEGYNINIPWDKPGMGDADYMLAFYQVVMPICDEYDPDLVIISAGFDAAHGDAIGGCHVSPNGYGYMTHLMKVLANGKLVVCLEGGYNLDAISVSALAVTKVLLGDPPGRISFGKPTNSAIETVEEVVQIQSKYWKSIGPHIPDQDPVPPSPTADSASADNSAGSHGFYSLYDLLRSAELRELSQKFGFASLPLAESNTFLHVSKDQVAASQGLFTASKILVVMHDASSVWGYREPITGMIKPTDSVVINSAKRYIDWAISNGFGVLDISVPADQYSGHPAPGYSDAQDLAALVWDSTLKYTEAQSVFFVGIGSSYAGLVHLAGHRDLRSRCEAVIGFIEDSPLKQVVSALDTTIIDWFYQVSLIFTNSNHKCWDAQANQKRPRKRFGRVIRTESEHLYEMVNERFEESTAFILDS